MNETQRGACPKCRHNTARVLATYRDERPAKYDDEYDTVNVFYILECRVCEEKYFKQEGYFTDIDQFSKGEPEIQYGGYESYWPPKWNKHIPDWHFLLGNRDKILERLFLDLYTALDNGLGIFAATGVRTIFDRSSEILGIDSNLTFRRKLRELQSRSLISSPEVKALTSIVEAGSAAAHRGWQPKSENLESMVAILESFLHRAFVLEVLADDLLQDVPSR